MYCIIKVLHSSDGAVTETGVSHRAASLLFVTLCAELKINTGDHDNSEGVVSPETPTYLQIFSNSAPSMPRLYVKQYTSQPSVHCLYRLYYQQRSHFPCIKTKKKLKKPILFDNLSTFKWSKKRDKVAINGRGFQEYRLQYKNVVQVVAHEACMCLCCPAHL